MNGIILKKSLDVDLYERARISDLKVFQNLDNNKKNKSVK